MTGTAIVRRTVDGVLLLNKPRGITSQQAVSRAKRLFEAHKAGHTGTLDPLADGLLPIGFGEATKFSQFLLDADKRYLAVLSLGRMTSTGDAEGAVLRDSPVRTTQAEIVDVIRQFTGPQKQTPPMHAALKIDGKPLYAYARAGQTVARKSRSIVINEIQLVDLNDNLLKIRVSCSKGTYIRVLAEDIGRALGCGAHLASLTRERAGGLDLADAISMLDLEGMTLSQRLGVLLPADTFATSLPRLDISSEIERRLVAGQIADSGVDVAAGQFRLYGVCGRFLGVGTVSEGKLTARRLMAQPARTKIPGIA